MDKEPVPFLVIERGCSSCLLLIPPTLWKSIKSQLCILDFEHILYQRIHNDPRFPRHCATYCTTFFLILPLILSSFHTSEKKKKMQIPTILFGEKKDYIFGSPWITFSFPFHSFWHAKNIHKMLIKIVENRDEV